MAKSTTLDMTRTYFRKVLVSVCGQCPPNLEKKLLAAAQQVLTSRLDPSGKTDTAGQSINPSLSTCALILATVVAETWAGRASAWKQADDEALRRRAKSLLPAYRLTMLIADALGVTAGQLERNVQEYHRVRKLAEGFEAAVAPRSLSTLVFESSFPGRVRTWVERHGWPPSLLLAAARKVLDPVPDCSGLLGRIPIERLRTYGDQELHQVAAHYSTWHALVEYLIDRRRSRGDPEHERKLGSLMRQVAVEFSGGAGNPRDMDPVVLDAAQNAVCKAIELAADPRRGYQYDQDFYQWLMWMTLCEITAIRRGRWGGEPGEPIADPQGGTGESIRAQHVELTALYIGWFTFCKYIFHDHFARLWQIWILRLLYEDEMPDQVLSLLLKIETGESVPASTLGGMRRKLRQRLRAVRRVHELPEEEMETKGRPDQIVAYVAGQHGVSHQEVRPLLVAVAYAQAARAEGDSLMLWATLVRLAVDLDWSRPQCEQLVMGLWELRLAAGGSDGGIYSLGIMRIRVERLWTCLACNQAAIGQLRSAASRYGVEHLMGPALYLRVLQRTSVSDTLTILQIEDSDARKAITPILESVNVP